MLRRPTLPSLLLPFLVLLLAGAPSAARPASLEEEVPPDLAHLLREAHGITRVGDELRGAGPSYAVAFERGGVRFEPFGAELEEPHELRLHGARARRGGVEVGAADPGARPREDGDRVDYDHGAFVERYELERDGVALSFVFDALPEGDGDLVVRLTLETDLELARTDPADGLVLAGEGRDVATIGGVTGVDANGATAPGWIRLVGDELELGLPADFVRGAALPLVLDPLIGSVDLTLAMSEFDLAREDFTALLVYRVGVPGDIRAVVLSTIGSPTSASIWTLDAGGDNRDPRVGSFDGDRYLIAWTETTGADHVQATTLKTQGSLAPIIGPVGTVTDAGLPEERTPDVGQGGTYVPVVWEEVGGGIRGASLRHLLGLVQAVNTWSVTTSTFDGSPRLANSDATGSWTCCTWVRRVPLAPDVVYGRRWLTLVDSGPAASLPEFLVASDFGLDRPDVSGAAGNDWFFVWQVEESPQTPNTRDVQGRRVSFPKPGDPSAAYGPLLDIAAESGTTQELPVVAWIRGTYVVAFVDPDAFVSRGLVLDASTGQQLEYVRLAITTADEQPAMAGTSDAFDGGIDEALYVHDLEVLRIGGVGGTVRDVGGACAFGSSARVSAALDGSQEFTHELWNATPNHPAFLSVAVSLDPLPLGGATFVPDLTLGKLIFVGLTDGNGFASKRTPISGLTGVILWEQWSVFVPGSTCTPFELRLSNCLEVYVH